MRTLRAAGLVASLVFAPSSWAGAAEVCRYEGVTTHSGHVAVRTEVTADRGLVMVDVMLALTASTWLFDVRYLRQEITTWRDGSLQELAVNSRDSVDGRIRRQQWDVFQRGGGGLEARRVQAKAAADLQRRHPGFVGHWSAATFGQPWLQDYAGANPERRPDLDLADAVMPPGLRSPLALAFYWSRRLPSGGGTVPVFLPGFKRHALGDLRFDAAMSGQGWRLWQARVRHADLSAAAASAVQAWVAPDGRLLQLAFDVHARLGSASGVIRSQGCAGTATVPRQRQPLQPEPNAGR